MGFFKSFLFLIGTLSCFSVSFASYSPETSRQTHRDNFEAGLSTGGSATRVQTYDSSISTGPQGTQVTESTDPITNSWVITGPQEETITRKETLDGSITTGPNDGTIQFSEIRLPDYTEMRKTGPGGQTLTTDAYYSGSSMPTSYTYYDSQGDLVASRYYDTNTSSWVDTLPNGEKIYVQDEPGTFVWSSISGPEGNQVNKTTVSSTSEPTPYEYNGVDYTTYTTETVYEYSGSGGHTAEEDATENPSTGSYSATVTWD